MINQWIPRTIFCIYIYDTISTLTLHLPGNLIPHLRATLGHPDALVTSFEIARPRLGSVVETQCWLEKSTQKVQVHYQEGFSV